MIKVSIKCYEQTEEEINFKRRGVKEIFTKVETFSQVLMAK